MKPEDVLLDVFDKLIEAIKNKRWVRALSLLEDLIAGSDDHEELRGLYVFCAQQITKGNFKEPLQVIETLQGGFIGAIGELSTTKN